MTIEAPRRRPAAVAHLRVGVTDHPIRRHPVADGRLAGIVESHVLVNDLGQQIGGPEHRQVVGHLALPSGEQQLFGQVDQLAK